MIAITFNWITVIIVFRLFLRFFVPDITNDKNYVQQCREEKKYSDLKIRIGTPHDFPLTIWGKLKINSTYY